MPANDRVVGVDGCKGGWFAVALNRGKAETACYDSFIDLITRYRSYRILIDIPMGLHSRRSLDGQARALLPGRRASVFPVPTREAVYAASYEEACRLNERLTGKRLSKQVWNICHKIREVDQVLVHEHLDIYESHPELAFSLLAGSPCHHGKRTAAGREERLAILAGYLSCAREIFEDASLKVSRARVAADDILDAMALLVTGKGGTRLLEDPMETDDRGIPIRMLIHRQRA